MEHVYQVKREMCHCKIVRLQKDLHKKLYLTKMVELGLKEKHFHQIILFFYISLMCLCMSLSLDIHNKTMAIVLHML